MMIETAHLADRLIAIGPAELDRRRLRLVEAINAADCDMLVTFDAAAFTYLTGYQLAGNERPFVAILDQHGDLNLIVPRLKHTDVRSRARADKITVYDDYPGKVHPIRIVADLVNRSGARRPLLEHLGHWSPNGYRGPNLTDHLSVKAVHRPDIVQTMRLTKSQNEIELIRHASDWAVYAQKVIMTEVRAGRSESQVAGAATGQVMQTMRRYYNRENVASRSLSVAAGFGGQIGPDGSAHHLQLWMDPVICAGDLMITRIPAHVGGYYSDIERTMICERRTPQVEDLYQRGLDVHMHALAQVKPGIAASEIDSAVSTRFEQLGIAEYWGHHVGHGIGLLEREDPYIDVGTETVLEPGMIFTVEPGVYRPGVGGFRHSDCVLITADGADILTDHPRDMESLTCAR